MDSIFRAPGPQAGWRGRLLAAALSATLGAGCGDEVGRLTQELTGNANQCETAARALGALGPGAATAAPAMFDVVIRQRRTPGATCWVTVVDELPKLGPAATSLLLTALGDRRAEDAAYVLASMGESGLPTLSAALKDPKTAEGAADAIAFLGRPGAPALGALRDARQQGLVGEKKFLATISWFRALETVPDFAAALHSKDIEVRWMATRALADVAAKSPPAVEALAFALEDDSVEIRNFAIVALSKAGPAAHSAVPAVRHAAQRRLISSGQARSAIQRMQPR